MRKSILGTMVVACAFAFTVGMQAQDKPAPKEHTMSGCVTKGATADTFTIANTAAGEKGPKVISIVASKDSLAGHVGHKVDITGTGVPNAEAEAMKPAPPKGDHYMRVSAVKMVAAKCP